jgi:hypothetical protein
MGQDDTAILRTGTVSFFHPANGGLGGLGGLGVRLDESPADGRVDRVYLLQGTEQVDDAPVGEMVGARVLDHRRALIVAGMNGPVQVLALEVLDPAITLAVREETTAGIAIRERQILRELAGDGEVVQRIGVGLIQSTGDTSDGGPRADGDSDTCQAGGQGATSAALGCREGSACQATCQDDFYPCLRCTDSGGIQCHCVNFNQ